MKTGGFSVAAHLNEAVDWVRRAEHKKLMAAGDETRKGSRQLWLYNPMNFSAEQAAEFRALRDSGLKVARAWAAKELFSRLCNYRHAGAAIFPGVAWLGEPEPVEGADQGGEDDQASPGEHPDVSAPPSAGGQGGAVQSEEEAVGIAAPPNSPPGRLIEARETRQTREC